MQIVVVRKEGEIILWKLFFDMLTTFTYSVASSTRVHWKWREDGGQGEAEGGHKNINQAPGANVIIKF